MRGLRRRGGLGCKATSDRSARRLLVWVCDRGFAPLTWCQLLRLSFKKTNEKTSEDSPFFFSRKIKGFDLKKEREREIEGKVIFEVV